MAQISDHLTATEATAPVLGWLASSSTIDAFELIRGDVIALVGASGRWGAS